MAHPRGDDKMLELPEDKLSPAGPTPCPQSMVVRPDIFWLRAVIFISGDTFRSSQSVQSMVKEFHMWANHRLRELKCG
jgi:hypothetical protein